MSELKLAFNKRTNKNHLVKADGSTIEFDYGVLGEGLRVDKSHNLLDLSISSNSPSFSGGTDFSDAYSQQYLDALSFDVTSVGTLSVWLEAAPVLAHLFTNTGLTAQAVDTNIIQGWKDFGEGFHLTEATNGPTLDYPADQILGVGNRGDIVFDGTDDLLTGASAANWNFLHNGTGMTIFGVALPQSGVNCALFDTTLGASGIGCLLWVDDAGGALGRSGIAIRNSGGDIGTYQASSAADTHPGGEIHCLSGCMKTGEDLIVMVDGCIVVRGALTGTPTATNCAGPMRIGHGFSTAFDANKYAALICYKTYLTITQQRQVVRYLCARYGLAAGNIACMGDSITVAGTTHVTTDYPARLVQKLGTLWSTTNYAVSGNTFALQYNNYWLTTAGAEIRRHNFVSILLGVNEVGGGITYAQLEINARIFFDDVLDPLYHRKLIIGTILPWSTSSAWTQAKQDITERYNTFILTYQTNYPDRVRVVDLYSAMVDPSVSTALNPLYLADDLHPNQAGSDIIASMFAEAALDLGLL